MKHLRTLFPPTRKCVWRVWLPSLPVVKRPFGAHIASCTVKIAYPLVQIRTIIASCTVAPVSHKRPQASGDCLAALAFFRSSLPHAFSFLSLSQLGNSTGAGTPRGIHLRQVSSDFARLSPSMVPTTSVTTTVGILLYPSSLYAFYVEPIHPTDMFSPAKQTFPYQFQFQQLGHTAMLRWSRIVKDADQYDCAKEWSPMDTGARQR